MGKLTGYTVDDIVGRSCRFLVDPVPRDMVDQNMRRHARDFCNAVRDGREYQVPDAEREPWMPAARPADELLCMQTNARKDGSIFHNMFFLKVFEIGADLGEEKPYSVGLQSELPEGKMTLAKIGANLSQLDANMDQIKDELASVFFMSCSMQRAVK